VYCDGKEVKDALIIDGRMCFTTGNLQDARDELEKSNTEKRQKPNTKKY
jgi:hypothetical protein